MGKVNWPAARLAPIQFAFFVYDVTSSAPVGGASVTLCNTNDPACASPLVMGTTDDAGTVTMTRPAVQAPLLHYADVSSPATVPLVQFAAFPLSEAAWFAPLPTLQAGALPVVAEAAMVTYDAGLGTVFASAVDCRLAVAPGVHFSVAPGQSQPVYYAGTVPDSSASATDETGLAAFFNVPVIPAVLTLTATPQALGRPSSTIRFFARSGGMATVYAIPTSPP